jgi:hypothetical protein
MDKDIPMLSSFISNADLTKFGKIFGEGKETDLTEISKASKPANPKGRPNDIVGKFSPQASYTRI